MRACLRSLFTSLCLLLLTTPTLSQTAHSSGSTTSSLIKVDSKPLGSGPVLSGLDVLKRSDFKLLQGKKVALLTNISAIDRNGTHLLDLLFANKNIELVTLFSPEHGLYGDLDTKVPDVKDTATGLMVHSLYSDRQGAKMGYPRQTDLEGLDVVVVDLMDIGARYYTYISYMGMMMEACAEAGVEVVVLDRPNPIGGLYVDGPQQDFDMLGKLTSYFPMPVAHGMTLGELAEMFNAEKKIDCKLTVVTCENWTRDLFLDQTGLRWVNPSPNIQDLDAAIVYTGIAITEAIMSMGRGTTEPFHIFGSPVIENPEAMIKYVEKTGIKGVKLEPYDFVPTGTLARHHHGEGKLCRGARMTITDRDAFRSFHLGLAVIDYMQGTYGKQYNTNGQGQPTPKYPIWSIRGALSSWVCSRTVERKPLQETLALVEKQVAEFLPMRKKYLKYPEREKAAESASER